MNRSRARTLAHALVALSVCIGLTCVTAAPSSAATAPEPVTGVTVAGTQATSQVAISWKYANALTFGARVVVVPGPTPTTDPADARAVFAQNVAAPAKSVLWTGTPGDLYSVSVFAYDSTATAFAAPATGRAPLPGPVRHLFVLETGDEEHTAYFTMPAHANAAVLCYHPDRMPTSPGDAEDCSFPNRTPWLDLYGDEGPDLFFVVFSVDTKTEAYGPGVSERDGELPTTPNRVDDAAVDSTSLKFLWAHESLGRTDTSFVDTRTWEVIWAPGIKSPVGNASASRVVVPTSGDRSLGVGTVLESYRATGLTPDVPYTFAVRTMNAVGDLGEWTTWTAAPRVAGAYLVDNGGPKGALRSSRAPTPAIPVLTLAAASLAVEGNGTAHTAVYEYYGRAGSALHGFRAPGAAWRKAAFPRGVMARVRLANSTVTPGVIAIADRFCVRVRSAAGVWKVAGCMEPPRPETTYVADFLDSDEIFGLELDKAGAVHVLYRTAADTSSLRYGTNASGKWTTRVVTSLTGSTGVAFTRDVATDRLVLAVGEMIPGLQDRHLLKITSKAPTAAGFDAFRIRSDTPTTRAVVPLSVASFGGRISLVALRSSISGYAGPVVKPWGSPVVLTGTSPANVGGMTAIPGAHVSAEPRVAAASAGRVYIAWSDLAFNVNTQGVWSIARSYPAARAATWTPRVRQSRSAYDELHGLAVDKAGRSYVLLYRR